MVTYDGVLTQNRLNVNTVKVEKEQKMSSTGRAECLIGSGVFNRKGALFPLQYTSTVTQLVQLY